MNLTTENSSSSHVFGDPAGLFVQFFTEMWERFSYYGMRALLTVFLVSTISEGGWGWTSAEALQLYGLYTSLVYATPLLGGLLADKVLGFKKAILIGALTMTLGHASMALEGIHQYFFFAGLVLMILGNGMFKPNISSMVGQLYPDNSPKKDAGYTIFYMGINAGAFLGSLLCGYLGEKIGWHYGFGLAGVFMFFGMLQFYFAQRIFGKIGDKPVKTVKTVDEIPVEEIPVKVVNDRLFVIAVLMIASIFFFFAFEQAGGSMTIFAKDYTQRLLEGTAATTFKWIDALLTLVPIIAVTIVLYRLSSKIAKQYPLTILFTALSFTAISLLGFWKIYREFNALETEVTVSWFQILNAFFIVTLASLFSRLWEKVWNPSGPIKFALGLLLVGVGFLVLAYGSMGIHNSNGEIVKVSMIWLILAYFFHTLGELCLSPVGLSYVSKLSPKKLLGLIFGFWFLASAISNFLAGWTGGMIDRIAENYSMSTFFLIIASLPVAVGIILILMNPLLKRKMHGIR